VLANKFDYVWLLKYRRKTIGLPIRYLRQPRRSVWRLSLSACWLLYSDQCTPDQYALRLWNNRYIIPISWSAYNSRSFIFLRIWLHRWRATMYKCFIRPKRTKKTMFTRSAITPPKVNRFGWNLEHC